LNCSEQRTPASALPAAGPNPSGHDTIFQEVAERICYNAIRIDSQSSRVRVMIERDFDVAFIAGQALREKQVQQNYRPIIAVHKWFARRPGTLFRSLLLSEFCEGELTEEFYRSRNLKGKRIADPFMGGGTPLLSEPALSV
jgi:hypothetical protein